MQGIGRGKSIWLIVGGCLMACSSSDEDFARDVRVEFSLKQIGNVFTFGLRVKNVGDRDIYPGARRLQFYLDAEPTASPDQLSREWEGKAILPGAPKGRWWRRDADGLASSLGSGIHAMQWRLGPVASNTIRIEVSDDGSLTVLEALQDPRTDEVADAYAARYGEDVPEPTPVRKEQAEPGGGI